MKTRSGRYYIPVFLLVVWSLLLTACATVKVRLGPDAEAELKEVTLEGKGREKVLVIPVRGFLSNSPKRGLLGERPSIVQEVVSQLKMAEKDDQVKAVLLKINSPGGSTTASDILYHEITGFMERKKVKVVAALMDVAASGGYYIALPADRIIAHPTTITGSVGVILMKPKVGGLMDKVGLSVEVNKSGQEKDIGSPFRPTSAEEQRILQELTDKLGKRFIELVARHRTKEVEALTRIASARIYLPEEALQLKLIDAIGYLDDALGEAREMAGLPKDAKVVVYRRTKRANDNIYNTSASIPWNTGSGLSLIDLNLADVVPALSPGLYYLWLPGAAGN
jgi:protease-4